MATKKKGTPAPKGRARARSTGASAIKSGTKSPAAGARAGTKAGVKSSAKARPKATPKAAAKASPKSPRPGKLDVVAQQAEARQLALTIAEVALEYKALNVEIIDVRGKVDYTDFVIVMSGRSDRQVMALSRNIDEAMQRDHGSRCTSVEGMPNGTWLLMDYGDVIVHIFHEDTRGYYDLETLWIDAARVSSAE